MTSSDFSGSCACGAVKIRAANVIGNCCYCHCKNCRQASGAPFVAWVSFARDAVRIEGGSYSIYRSSPHIERGFCRDCGSSISYRNETLENEIDLCTALLDEAGELAPVAHIWMRDKLPWVTPADGLPCFDEWREEA